VAVLSVKEFKNYSSAANRILFSFAHFGTKTNIFVRWRYFLRLFKYFKNQFLMFDIDR